jgi:glycogen synthase
MDHTAGTAERMRYLTISGFRVMRNHTAAYSKPLRTALRTISSKTNITSGARGLYGHYDDAERLPSFRAPCLKCWTISITDRRHPRERLAHRPDSGLPENLLLRREGYDSIQCLLTIHNIQYQASMGWNCAEFSASRRKAFSVRVRRHLNFLKAG